MLIMSVNFNKSGTINSPNFYESGAMNGVTNLMANTAYIPTTANNSTMTAFQWLVPEGSVVNETFRVFLTVDYSGFDSSNTSGTFSIYFQGANSTAENVWAYTGTNPITTALNNKQALTNLVLSSASGTYTYETTFTTNQTYLSSYLGSRIGIRSNYSNGTGRIALSNCKIIPEKFMSNNNTAMRISDNYIAVQEFIEI